MTRPADYLTSWLSRFRAALRFSADSTLAWDPKCPSFGHCAAVAVLIHRVWGGEFVSTRVGGESHWFNRVRVHDGRAWDMDATADQFHRAPAMIAPAGEVWPNARVRAREEVRSETIDRADVLAMTSMGTDTRWCLTDKGDLDARDLVDGTSVGKAPHYSRQTPGARSFTRNGQNLVFMLGEKQAVWVTFRPTPGKAVRSDKLKSWECALFRLEQADVRASALIREAVELSVALWGPWPEQGMVTFIRPDAVPTEVKGYCYRRAGWKHRGEASDGKPRLFAPVPLVVRPYYAWRWKGERGGRLRETLLREFDHPPSRLGEINVVVPCRNSTVSGAGLVARRASEE